MESGDTSDKSHECKAEEIFHLLNLRCLTLFLSLSTLREVVDGWILFSSALSAVGSIDRFIVGVWLHWAAYAYNHITVYNTYRCTVQCRITLPPRSWVV